MALMAVGWVEGRTTPEEDEDNEEDVLAFEVRLDEAALSSRKGLKVSGMYWAAGRLTEKWKRSFSSQMRRRKGWRRQQGPRPPSPPARSQSPTIDILFSLESVSEYKRIE
ncbi:hypothetical protein HPP92_007665 [Vanilla planifolia]|uniref:Uncharacterized protein n=1 Tax=Vanilla planifolia TaxID=51239 RepID=A0A835RRU2_VANPL|nr:hypothetical protein HPP92_007665 [Vanilla planifolia]